MYDSPKFLAAGDQAIVIELGDEISAECNRRVHNLRRAIQREAVQDVIDLIPTYRSLLVQYDGRNVSYADMEARLSTLLSETTEGQEEAPVVVHLPTLYEGEYGPDLEFVAENAGMGVAEVIEIHSGTDYLVYMMGFTPGFPYLGGMSQKIATPRLPTPRGAIPTGSVGIAEAQTGVYPIESPGGWRLIGRTPLRLFDAAGDQPSVLDAGDYVRFVPMSGEDEYRETLDLVVSGDYKTITSAKE
jgi:KipI family sensor histidine kinase inhibitor